MKKSITKDLIKVNILSLTIILFTFITLEITSNITIQRYEKLTYFLHNFADIAQTKITELYKYKYEKNKNLTLENLSNLNINLLKLKNDLFTNYKDLLSNKHKDYLKKNLDVLMNLNINNDTNLINDTENAYISILILADKIENKKSKFYERGTIFFSIVLLIIFLITIFILTRKIKTLTLPLIQIRDNAKKLSISNESIFIETDYGHQEFSDLANTFKEMHQRVLYENRISSNKSATEFVSYLSENLAHTINNPLAVIATTVKIIKKKAIKNDDKFIISEMDAITNELERITETTHKMKRLIHTSSREESDFFDPSNISTNINLLFFNKFFEKNINFQVIIDFEGLIFAKENILNQIVMTLIDNAIKYNDNEKPEIILRISKENENFKISVSDNGTTIDDFVIYQHFLGESNTENFGLYTTRKLATENGYDFSYSSNPIKEFILMIPFSTEESQ